jgi:transcriptional regulator with XRE-family HTH domain
MTKEEFKKLRLYKLHMTQEQLATELGVSRGLIAQWENGDTKLNKRTMYAIYWIIHTEGK